MVFYLVFEFLTFSTNIEKFITSGIIKFQKMKKDPIDSFLLDILLGKEVKLDNNKEELYFNAVIITDVKK